jgi:hypothetical protein
MPHRREGVSVGTIITVLTACSIVALSTCLLVKAHRPTKKMSDNETTRLNTFYRNNPAAYTR